MAIVAVVLFALLVALTAADVATRRTISAAPAAWE